MPDIHHVVVSHQLWPLGGGISAKLLEVAVVGHTSWTKQPTVPLLPLCMNVDTAGYTPRIM